MPERDTLPAYGGTQQSYARAIEDVPLVSLTWCLIILAGAVDRSLDVDIVDVRMHALDLTLIPWLAHDAFNGELREEFTSLRLMHPDSIRERATINSLAAELLAQRSGRITTIKSSGVALLIAIFTEAIQRLKVA